MNIHPEKIRSCVVLFLSGLGLVAGLLAIGAGRGIDPGWLVVAWGLIGISYIFRERRI